MQMPTSMVTLSSNTSTTAMAVNFDSQSLVSEIGNES